MHFFEAVGEMLFHSQATVNPAGGVEASTHAEKLVESIGAFCEADLLFGAVFNRTQPAGAVRERRLILDAERGKHRRPYVRGAAVVLPDGAMRSQNETTCLDVALAQ